MIRATLLAMCLVFQAAGTALAAPMDWVEFSNGNLLSGDVQSVDAKELKLKHEVLGTVSIPREKVRAIYFALEAAPPVRGGNPAAPEKNAAPDGPPSALLPPLPAATARNGDEPAKPATPAQPEEDEPTPPLKLDTAGMKFLKTGLGFNMMVPQKWTVTPKGTHLWMLPDEYRRRVATGEPMEMYDLYVAPGWENRRLNDPLLVKDIDKMAAASFAGLKRDANPVSIAAAIGLGKQFTFKAPAQTGEVAGVCSVFFVARHDGKHIVFSFTGPAQHSEDRIHDAQRVFATIGIEKDPAAPAK